MKNFVLVIVLCAAMLIGAAGCEPEQVKAAVAQQAVLQQQLDTLQADATRMTEELVASGVVDAKLTAKIAKINEEADRVQAQFAAFALGLKDVPLTGDKTQDWVAMLQAANVASGQTGLNPYAVPVGVGLTLLTGVLGWLARRKAAEAAVAKAEAETAQTETKAVEVKYQAHKQGVEKTMKEVSASTDAKVKAVETQLYDNIGEARVDLRVG